jgi:hypothetical protein
VESGSEMKWWCEGGSEGREDFVAMGTVAIKDVQFDDIKRKMLDSSVLNVVILPKDSA